MKRKRAFTLVELLTVIAVISILITIVVVATAGALKSAREKRTEAMRVVLEQAIAAYYAQSPDNKWPDAIEEKIRNLEDNTVTLTADEADRVFRQIVKKGYGKGGGKQSALVDASALYVCEASNSGGARAGVDFADAVKHGVKRHIPIDQMAFGYPDAEYGKFRRFKIVYNSRTDSVQVTK